MRNIVPKWFFGTKLNIWSAKGVRILWKIMSESSIFDSKTNIIKCSALRPYNPLFWPQTDPTQWDHNFPMSWGNFGYLRFSCRCPFGCSAGRFLAPNAQNGPFWVENAIFRPQRLPWRPNYNWNSTKKLPFCSSVVMLTNKWDAIPKNTVFGPRNCIFSSKISFLLRYAQITLFFGFRQTWLNGTISFPCPEVTLDTFGFPVGARSATWRAVFWHQLPKMALFGANNALFWSLMYYMLSYSIVRYCIAFLCTIWYILLPYGNAWCPNVMHCIIWYLMVSNSTSRFWVVGFGARAVSHKTPIYFMYYILIVHFHQHRCNLKSKSADC